MAWHIKKADGSVYGPVELSILQAWAEEGRVAPEDQLSADEDTWSPAPDLEDLGMEWLVRFADRSQYGPVHLLALREPVRTGAIPPDTQVLHKERVDSGSIAEKLLPLLAEHAYQQEEALARAGSQALATPAAAPVDEAAPPRLEEAEQRVRDLTTEVEAARLRTGELENDCAALREKLRLAEERTNLSENPSGDAMLDTYADLSRNYDLLLDQLRDKTSELQRALAARDEVTRHSEDRVHHLEQLVRREQEETQKLRRRLDELEETHFSMVKSFRELNERFINMKRSASSRPESPNSTETPGR